MSEQINPGDGWRLLGPDEVVRDGDEPWHRFEKRWMQIPMDVPYTAKAYPAVRRRIPAKPEEVSVGELSVLNLEMDEFGNVKFYQDRNWVELNELAAIRQLIAWMQQVADWRDAQGDSK